MSDDPCLTAPTSELLKGIEEFNLGKYYECHDTLEELWMAEPRPVRSLYQGVLQIGVAFYHLGRSRYRPVVTLLERGSGYLEPFAPACMGIDVTGLIEGAARCLADVKRLGPDRLNDFDWGRMALLVAFNDGLFEGVAADDVAALLGELEQQVQRSALRLDSPREEWSAAVASWLSQPLPEPSR